MRAETKVNTKEVEIIVVKGRKFNVTYYESRRYFTINDTFVSNSGEISRDWKLPISRRSEWATLVAEELIRRQLREQELLWVESDNRIKAAALTAEGAVHNFILKKSIEMEAALSSKLRAFKRNLNSKYKLRARPF